MEKFEHEEIETYDTTRTTEPPRPKRSKKFHNYKQLNDGAAPLMDMSYEESFLNDKTPTPKINQTNIKTGTIVDDEEAEEDPMKNLRLKCLICYKSFKFRSAFSTRNHFSSNYCSKVLNTLYHLLQQQDDEQSCKWDFDFDEFPLPFCTECSKVVIGILRLQQLIEGYQQSVLEAVHDIKAQIHETEANIPNLELLDDDNNEILNRYKDRIKILRKSAINDFDPSSDSRKFKVCTERKTWTRRSKEKRMDDWESLEEVHESEGLVESHDHDQEAPVPKNNKANSNLNPRVLLTKIEPELAASALHLNLGKTPQLSKRSSALRARKVLATALKLSDEDDDEEEYEGEEYANMNPDPEWSENDDNGDEDDEDEVPSEDSVEDEAEENEEETIEQMSDRHSERQVESDTKALSNSTKKNQKSATATAPPKKSHKKKGLPPKVPKPKSPFIETKDGKLLLGNIEIQKVKVEAKPQPQTKKRIPLIITKDGKLLFGDIQIQRVKMENESKFKCNTCGTFYKGLKGIKNHIKASHLNINRRTTVGKGAVTCHICGKVLQNPASLPRHHKVVHFQSNTPHKTHQCEICGKSFGDYRSVGHHKVLIHQVPIEAVNLTFYSCDICSKPFTDNKTMKIHRLSHMNDEEKIVETLKLQEEYPNLILYQCTVCGKSATNAAGLKLHELTHTKEKRFQCHVCCQTFAYKQILKDHLVTHQAEHEIDFKFICDFPGCDKKYWRKRQLINHSYAHRPPEDRPHKCTMCDATFVRVGQLRDHKRQHTGERPFICEYCQKTFSRSNDLRKHYKNVHKIMPRDIGQMPSMKPQLLSTIELCGLDNVINL